MQNNPTKCYKIVASIAAGWLDFGRLKKKKKEQLKDPLRKWAQDLSFLLQVYLSLRESGLKKQSLSPNSNSQWKGELESKMNTFKSC